MTELGFALFEGEPKPDEAINLHIANAIARVEGLNNEALQRIDRAFELLKLEEAGRLVTLPCKVGDTVWTISEPWTAAPLKKPLAVEVNATKQYSHGAYINLLFDTRKFSGTRDYNVNNIGKTVFLTREEAEKALEEMK